MTVWILVLQFRMLTAVVYTRPIGVFSTQSGCEQFIQHEARETSVTGLMCFAETVKRYP